MQRNKTSILFFKRLIKYFLILAIFILMMAPLYVKSYDLAKWLTIEKSSARLEDGIGVLERQVLRAQEIGNLLRQEESFKRLFFLQGKPSSAYYYDFERLQTKLKSLSLTQDLFSNAYIAFRDNPVLVSNSLSSDNADDVYRRYYRYPGMTAQEWKTMLFGKTDVFRILPSKTVHSSYYSRHDFQAMTVLINNSYYNALDVKSVLAIDINTEDIAKLLLYEEQLGDHQVYLTDLDGNLLLAKGSEASASQADTLQEVLTKQASVGGPKEGAIELNSQQYVTLSDTSAQLGIRVVVAIPSSTFETNIDALMELVVTYAAAGAVVVVLLAVLFSMRETLTLRKLVETAGTLSQVNFTTLNEYKYMDRAFTRIRSINEEQLGRIEALNISIRYSVLKNLLVLGVHTQRELEEAIDCFGDTFERFCIAKARWSTEENTEERDEANPAALRPNPGIELEKVLRTLPDYGVLALHFHANEAVFVLFGKSEEEGSVQELGDRLSGMLRRLSRDVPSAAIIDIGLSGIESGLKQARPAYEQAQYALSLHENGISSGVHVFERSGSGESGPEFDHTIPLKLHDALIAGEERGAEQIFADASTQMADHARTEQERLQIFFTVRQTVSNAHKVMRLGNGYKEETKVEALPEYDQTKDVFKLFGELEQTALELCRSVIGRKKSNNDRLKADILNYIAENYGDSSLSAGKIAGELMLSEKYVFSFVKEQTGKSLGKYIEEIRLDKAEHLLIQTDEPNSAILKKCGFGSENTFYRAFSKKHGVTPSSWKETHRKLT